MKYNKPALSYSEQVKCLESRGLTIENREEAVQFLAKVNYYRFSAYCIPFESKRHQFRDRFLEQTSDYFGVIKDDEIRAIANKIGKSKIRNNPSETTINEAYKIYKKIKNGQLFLENNRLIES